MVEEVHLWRGSPAQRGMRDALLKTGQYRYFSQQLGLQDWSGLRVLDFGGNVGSLLMDASSTIAPARYTCVDVLREALEVGRSRFPQASWVHYDRYNCSFNPTGRPDARLPALEPFDVIVAFSVFTHTALDETRDLVEQLRGLLAPGGVLAFTFIDPHVEPWPDRPPGSTTLRWRLEKNRRDDPDVDVDGLVERSRGARWCALLGSSDLYLEQPGDPARHPDPCLTYNVYYTRELIAELFPGATIAPPVAGEMQHCCILHG